MTGKNHADEARYRAIFENSHHSIILFNKTDFTIQEVNDAFLNLLHYNPEELIAKKVTSFFFDDKEKNRFLTQIGDPEIHTFETRFETKEGNSCWVELFWETVDDTTFICTAINIHPRKISEKAISDQLIQYHQLIEKSPTSILIVRNGKILHTNPAFSDFSGHTQEEVAGKDLLSFVNASDQDEFETCVKHWSEKMQKTYRSEFRFVTKAGEIRMAILIAIPIIYSNEPATLINLVDISEKQRLEDKIQLDNERRRGIIITVAHELRTPLQPILGYLNLLVQDPEGFGILEDTKKILERCLVSVERERQIINQMLDLSVLESGRLQLRYSTFPLASLINSVLDSSGYLSKAEIIFDIPDTLIIAADMDRLFGVFDSLFSNAVNFSIPPRVITIFYRSDRNDPCHHISIKDNGTGISESALSSIFEPFQLADAAKLSRKYDRIGLSLSIAKKIMQMHGGDITVESILNSGSTFTIHLPKESRDTI